jgi:anaerobic selenocysteine-containing dehydrogenase
MNEKGLIRPLERSTLLEEAERPGTRPLPFYTEPPESPYSQPKLAEKYPFILTTGEGNLSIATRREKNTLASSDGEETRSEDPS